MRLFDDAHHIRSAYHGLGLGGVIHTGMYNVKDIVQTDKAGVLHNKKATHGAGRRNSCDALS